MASVPSDLQEFSVFYRLHFPTVARAVRPIVGDEADDVAQDAFLQLQQRWASVSGYDAPHAWVRRVAIRIAVRQAKRDRLRGILERELEPPVQRVPRDLDLDRALAELPDPLRAAVVMHHLEDRPVAELAALFGCSESVVRVWLHRARNQLADRVAGLRGTWVAESAMRPGDVVRALQGTGRERYVDRVLEHLPPGGNRFVLSLARGRFTIANDGGAPLDRGTFRLQPRGLVLRSRGYAGSATHRVEQSDHRLRLVQVENANPAVYGVPDEVFQDLLYGSSAFAWAG